ncbi:CRISPR-associated protein Cas2 [[Haemophilus] felis]|nr:CRISPR-associated protein Cas2 [[Haemophilus] felis]
MKNYLISYDLISPKQSYEPLIKEIKSFRYWAKLNFSTWYVKSDLPLDQLSNRLTSIVDEDDVVIVAEMTNLAWSDSLSKEIKNFVLEHWYL